MSEEITLTENNFEAEVINSPVPVLIDFWASWCGPCRMIGPVVSELASEYAGRLKVCTVDIDEEGEIAERHGIASIPTLVVYKAGEQVNKRVGAAPKREIEALFKDLL